MKQEVSQIPSGARNIADMFLNGFLDIQRKPATGRKTLNTLSDLPEKCKQKRAKDRKGWQERKTAWKSFTCLSEDYSERSTIYTITTCSV